MNKQFPLNTRNDLDTILRDLREAVESGEHVVEVRGIDISRSAAQNRLAYLWHKEAAEQKNDETADDKRAYCKLTIGIPLRREDEKYRNAYDEHVRPLPYEVKIACMKEPIDWPVTRGMGVKMMARYLEGVERHYTEQGVVLSKPEDLYLKALMKK